MSEPAVVLEDRMYPGEWRVEWYDDHKLSELAVFSGPMPASEPSNTRNCNTGITTTSALVADVDHTTRLTDGVRY